MTEIRGNSHAGSLIRELRIREGLTQDELARKLQCNSATVSRLESAPITKTSTLQRVLGALGYDIVYTAVCRNPSPPVTVDNGECPRLLLAPLGQ